MRNDIRSEHVFILPSGSRFLVTAKRSRENLIKVYMPVNRLSKYHNHLDQVELWIINFINNISSCIKLDVNNYPHYISNEDRLFIDEIIKSNKIDSVMRFSSVASSVSNRKHYKLLRDSMPIYSSLRREVENVRMKKAKPEQWLGWIDNLKNITKNEISSCGIRQYLIKKYKSEILSKQDILNHLSFSHVSPSLYRLVNNSLKSRSVLRKSSISLPTKVIKTLPTIWADSAHVILIHPSFNQRVVEVKFNDLFGLHRFWLAYDENWKPILHELQQAYMSLTDAVRSIHVQMDKRRYKSAVYTDAPVWEAYVLPGGEKTQNWLVMLDELPPVFCYSEHYDVQNALLHLRTSIRRTTAGKKILFIEELQSDWMQKLDALSDKELTSLGREWDMPWQNSWYELGLKISIYLALQQDCVGVGISPGHVHVERYGSVFGKGGIHFYDNILTKYMKKFAKPWGAKVHNVNLQVGITDNVITSDASHYQVLNKMGYKVGSEVKSLEEAKKVLSKLSEMTDLTAPVLEMTVSMKKHILENGVSLFGSLKLI